MKDSGLLTRRGLAGALLAATQAAAQTTPGAAPKPDAEAEAAVRRNAQAVAAGAGDPQADPAFRFQP